MALKPNTRVTSLKPVGAPLKRQRQEHVSEVSSLSTGLCWTLDSLFILRFEIQINFKPTFFYEEDKCSVSSIEIWKYEISRTWEVFRVPLMLPLTSLLAQSYFCGKHFLLIESFFERHIKVFHLSFLFQMKVTIALNWKLYWSFSLVKYCRKVDRRSGVESFWEQLFSCLCEQVKREILISKLNCGHDFARAATSITVILYSVPVLQRFMCNDSL